MTDTLTADDIRKFMAELPDFPQPRAGIYDGTVDEAASFVFIELTRLGPRARVETREPLVGGGSVIVVESGLIIASSEVIAKVRATLAALRSTVDGMGGALPDEVDHD